MMRRRFRRRRAKWTHSDSGNMQINASSVGQFGAQWSWFWVMPPGRAQFLMDTGRRNSITFAGAHLWLDFYWWSSASTQQALPDVDFAMYKTGLSEGSLTAQPDLTIAAGQWKQPATPATITSWEEDDDDGTESFLWQHHIKGFSPPNAIVEVAQPGLTNTQNDLGTNQYPNIRAASTDGTHHTFVCRKFMVTQEWQPDVVIRSKRRLQKGEGIVMTMAVGGVLNAGMNATCNVRLRTLTK